MKKIPQLLSYIDTAMVVLLSIYVILVLYGIIFANIFIPITLGLIFAIYLFYEKEDTARVKIRSIITVIPILSLAIISSIKKFM